MKIIPLKLLAKIRHILLSSAWISCICFNLNSQSPQNWIKPYSFTGIAGQHVNTILNVDSALWIFCGRDIYEVTDVQKAPVKISTLDISNPSIDSDKSIYFFRKDTVFVSSYDDFILGKISRYFILKTSSLPDCLNKGFSDRININCIASDPQGDYVWVGSEYHGLFKISKPNWKHQLWTPTWASYYLDKNCDHSRSSSHIISNQVKIVQFDSYGRLWIGFDLGLMIFDMGKFETLLLYHTVHALVEDKKKECVWLIAQGKGLGNQIFVFWNAMRDDWSDFYRSSTTQIWNEFEFVHVNGILIDHDGDLWGAGNCLMREKKLGISLTSKNDLEDKIKHNISQFFSYKEELTSKPLCLAEDKQGIIWIGTSSDGLFTLDKKPGLRIEQKKIIKCHNDKNGSFLIKPLEGKSPYKLYWTSSHNGSGEQSEFEFKYFENLSSDTFHFRLTDEIKIDTGHFRVILDNPRPISAKIRKELDPSYENAMDAVITVHGLKGGRVKRDEFEKLKGYKVRINDSKQLVDSLPHFGLGAFQITIVDTMECQFILKDTFSRSQHCLTYVLNREFDTKQFPFSEHESYFNIGIAINSSLIDNIIGVLNKCPSLKVNLVGYVGLKYPSDEQARRNNLPTAKELTLARAENISKILQSKKVPVRKINCSASGERKGAFVGLYFSY